MKVIPFFESSDKIFYSNYRPISVLCCFFNFEMVICVRLHNFSCRFYILCSNRFVFMSNHSNDMAVLQIVDNFIQAITNGNCSVGIFLDLRKAFGTVDHHIILCELSHYGMRGIALNCFRAYLLNRKQSIMFCGVRSNLRNIGCGILQDSVIGSLFVYIIYQ